MMFLVPILNAAVNNPRNAQYNGRGGKKFHGGTFSRARKIKEKA